MLRSLFGLLLIAATFTVNAESLTSVDIVNIAGRQRMLSQRIVKAYAQLGLAISPDNSRRILDESLRQFAGQLDTLRQTLHDPEQLQTLGEIENSWQEVRHLASGKVDLSDAMSMHPHANQLQSLSHHLAMRLADQTGSPVGHLVNLAGRQRMLSQRLSKVYFLSAWKNDPASFSTELDIAKGEFSAAIDLMRQAPENTQAIREELDALHLHWEWFRQGLALDGAVSYRHLVAETSESILGHLERLVALYANLERK